MANPIETAQQHGYSAEQINEFLSKKDPNYAKALQAGYKPEEIQSFLSKRKSSKEGLASNIGRQIGRSGARIVETVLGAPRAFGEFLEGLIPEQAITKGAEKIGLGEPVKKGFEFSKKFAPYKLFPKSEDIRENITKTVFGKKLEPKNEWEEKSDELISDFAALAIPLPGQQFKLAKPALISLGGNLAKEGVGYLGGTEKQKSYAKLGTILAGSIINPKGADNLKNDLYKQARNARPADASVKANNLIKSSENLELELLKGDPSTTSKKKALNLIKDIKSKVKNNEIEIDELEEFKRNINEARSGLYDEFKTDKLGRKSAKRNLDSVSNIIDKSLKEYGKQNPEWEAFYRPANEVHGAIAESKKMRNWIARHGKALGYPSLLAELGLYHFGGLPPVLTTAGIGITGLGAAEITSRIMKSPTLRKHYMNLITNAMKEDAIAVHENLKKLNEELKKEKP